MKHQLFTDGGTIGKNPSASGGTFCWCWVADGKLRCYESGMIDPSYLEVTQITNNIAELYAAIRGLSFFENTEGEWWTDSIITLRRLTTGNKFANCPTWMIRRSLELRLHRKYKPVLCGGHATKKELV